eukprot:Rhum_TRINITY_DN14870_c35_g1::Rhum_TRINITY_DN14870_c35_g1_i1::g.126372::m.126372
MTQFHHAAPDLIREPQLPSLQGEPNPFVVFSAEDVKRSFSNVRVVVAPPSADNDGCAAAPVLNPHSAAAPATVPAAVGQPQQPTEPQPQAVHAPAVAAAAAAAA